jgi:hypothetical protein
MSNTDDIRVYAHVGTSDEGPPRAEFAAVNGIMQVRWWPTGPGGIFLSMTDGALDANLAVLAAARAEYEAATRMPGDVLASTLGRTNGARA